MGSGVTVNHTFLITLPCSEDISVTFQASSSTQNNNNCFPSTVVFDSSDPTPVKLESFKASLNSFANSVELVWKTEMESGFDFFKVEKSNDAVGFETIGNISSSIDQNYYFTDYSPFSGQNYYRLKMIDIDKTYEYSKIVNVNNANSKLKIFPNPTSDDSFTVLGLSPDENILLHDNYMRQLPFDENVEVAKRVVKFSKTNGGFIYLKTDSGEFQKILLK